jgi:hypothetical protein
MLQTVLYVPTTQIKTAQTDFAHLNREARTPEKSVDGFPTKSDRKVCMIFRCTVSDMKVNEWLAARFSAVLETNKTLRKVRWY